MNEIIIIKSNSEGRAETERLGSRVKFKNVTTKLGRFTGYIRPNPNPFSYDEFIVISAEEVQERLMD